MNSYSTVTTKHISQFFYIWISTDVGCLPFQPSFMLLGGGNVNFGAWFMNNKLLDQKKDKIIK